MNKAQLVQPEVLARIQGLSLRARQVAEGVLSGLHRSRHRGASAEFVEHKEYAPGDDLRMIDWRAYGRRDKFSVKRFEEDTNIRAISVLDCSASMSYRGNTPGSGPTKFEYSQVLAASLTYLLLHQKDAVAVTGVGVGVSSYLPPRADWEHFHAALEVVAALQPTSKGDIAQGILELGAKLTRRSLVILFSDLFGDHEKIFAALRSLHHRRHDVAVFQIVDRAEMDFPFVEATRFEDLESDLKILLDPATLRKHYVREFQTFLEQARRVCLAEHIDYHLVVTDRPAEDVLLRFLERRLL